MDASARRALALGVAADLLVVVLARTVTLPVTFLPVAVPFVCAGGVVGGVLAGATLPAGRDGRALGALSGVAGGSALAATLWGGMALVVSLPRRTPVWGLAYLFATEGPVTATTPPLVAEAWVAAYALAVVGCYAVGGAVGAVLGSLWRRRMEASGLASADAQ